MYFNHVVMSLNNLSLMFFSFVIKFSQNNVGQSSIFILRASTMYIIVEEEILLVLVFNKNRELKNLKSGLVLLFS